VQYIVFMGNKTYWGGFSLQISSELKLETTAE
jgi:hypothetical protein